MAMEDDGIGDEKRPAHKGDKKLQCVVVTPERAVLDQAADFVAGKL